MCLKLFLTIMINFILLIKSFNQLSFSGGGSFGAIEIGILKLVVELNKNANYDLYTGISAGALNAGVLSHYEDIELGSKQLSSIPTLTTLTIITFIK